MNSTFNSLTMCPSNIALWCFVLLLIASFSECQRNSTNDDGQGDNSTIQYNDLFLSSTKNRNGEMESIRCNSREKSIQNDDEMQYESCINFTNNDRKNDDSVQRDKSRGRIIKNHKENNQMSMESYMNFTKNNDSTLQRINENFTETEDESNSNTDDYNNSTAIIVPYEVCGNVTCLQLCCPFGNNLTIQGKCVTGQGNYSFPDMYKYGNDSEDENQLTYLTIYDPCVQQGLGRRLLNADGYLFLINGSLYQGPGRFISPTSYCLAILRRNIYDVIVCTNQTKLPVYISACLLVSLPFLLLTFVVYSILPEL